MLSFLIGKIHKKTQPENHQTGLPIGKLLVACNENDVLYEFFTTKTYRVRPSAQVAKTSSPSMDIGKAPNFERYSRRIEKVLRRWLALYYFFTST